MVIPLSLDGTGWVNLVGMAGTIASPRNHGALINYTAVFQSTAVSAPCSVLTRVVIDGVPQTASVVYVSPATTTSLTQSVIATAAAGAATSFQVQALQTDVGCNVSMTRTGFAGGSWGSTLTAVTFDR